MPHLLQQGPTVYNGHLRGPVTLTPVAERLAVERRQRRKQVWECSHSVRPSVRPSIRPSVPESCHRNSSETTDPVIMKLGM